MFIGNKIYLGNILLEMVDGRLNIIAEEGGCVKLDIEQTRAIIDRLDCMKHGNYVYDLIKKKAEEAPKKLNLNNCPDIEAGDIVRYLPTGELCKVEQYGTLVDAKLKTGQRYLLGFECKLTRSDFQKVEPYNQI